MRTMRGQIMTKTESGQRWLYVPEAHIQVQVTQLGKLLVDAFRTDGYHIPTGMLVIDWLRSTCQFTAEVDVPEWVVDFAVESERQRQEEVCGEVDALQAAVEEGGKKLSERAFLDLLATKATEDDPDLEHRVALEIQRIMKEAGGQQ